MDIFQSIFLGIIQGITEFLPVSSSGHLVVFQKIFGFVEPPIFFDTLIHFATLIAVVFYLRKELLALLKSIKEKESQKIIGLIVLGTIPVVIVGFLIKDEISHIFNSFNLLGFSFLITSLILFSTMFFKNCVKDIKNLNWLDSLFIGVFQALAILPGISRSGSTISATLFRGAKREDAFRFSFLLAIPAITGAMVLQIIQIDQSFINNGFFANLAGFLSAMVFGLISLKILEKITVKGKLHYFAVYCLVLGLIILFI